MGDPIFCQIDVWREWAECEYGIQRGDSFGCNVFGSHQLEFLIVWREKVINLLGASEVDADEIKRIDNLIKAFVEGRFKGKCLHPCPYIMGAGLRG